MKNLHKGTIIVLAGLLLVSSLNLTKANAAVRYEEIDVLFQETLNGILGYENVEEAAVSAQKERLYDIELNELGVVYDFTYDEQEGFAIIIDDGTLKVTEVTMDGGSPYSNEAMKVYVSEGLYWYNDGGVFYDCVSDLPISDEAIEMVSETAYLGSTDLQYDSERIEYVYRSETSYNALLSIPLYGFTHEGGCAPVAGTNLIAYYDKTYPNLIPNYEPGRTIFGRYMFNVENETTMALSETLYQDMGTSSKGTSVSQFKSGIKKYVNRQGYSLSFQSLMSWGKIKYDTVKATVQQGKAIALFLLGYRGITITQNEGYDILTYEYTTANHVVAGFGCLEVNYTFADNSTRTDRYIHCSMGMGLYPNGYINVGSAKIDDALALNIT